MRVVALVSGGKDSCYSILKCVAAGHEVVALANLQPQDKDELDSFMFQSVGHEGVAYFAKAMGLPLYQLPTRGRAVSCDLTYAPAPGDEVEDLYELVRVVRAERGVEGVASGAVLSDYQRLRVENVCGRLGLTSLAYLWRRDQAELLEEMVAAGVRAVIIKVACIGLTEKHLGKTIEDVRPELMKLHQRYGVNVCGEGGEYETFTLDCPLFKKRIEIMQSEVCVHSNDAFAPVAYLKLTDLQLTDKDKHVELSANLPAAPCKAMWSPIKMSPTVLDCSPLVYRKGAYLLMAIDGNTSLKSAARQTEGIFEDIKTGLTQHDRAWSEVAMVYLYLSSMAEFPSVNTVYASFFLSEPPARVCVELPLPKGVLVRVEVMVCGCEAGEGGGGERRRTPMHVQSISHWAPANIGPYSQAVTVDKVIFLAGQIGLDPGSMALVCGERQASLSLSHVRAVLQANGAGGGGGEGRGFAAIIGGTCYYTSTEAGRRARHTWRKCVSSELCHEEPSCPPIVFLPVTALPRAAEVEWHFTAVQSKLENALKFSSHDNVEGGVVFSEKGAWSDDLCVGCWTVVISPIHDRVGFHSLNRTLECGLDRISHSLSSSCHLTLADLSLLRVCVPKTCDAEYSNTALCIKDLAAHCGCKAGDLPLSLLATEGCYGFENSSVCIQASKLHRTDIALCT